MSIAEYIFLVLLVALADAFGLAALLIIINIHDELHFFKREVRGWQENVCRVTLIHDVDEDGR